VLISFFLVTALFVKSWSSLKERYSEATLSEEYGEDTTEGRGYYLRLSKLIVQDHFFGVGLNNWSYWVSKKYGPQLGVLYEDYDDTPVNPDKEELNSYRHAAPAHNLAALVFGELGVPGLFLFGCLWIRWFFMPIPFLFKRNSDPLNLIAIGLLFSFAGVALQSLTEWVFRQTSIFLIFHILVGAVASLIHIEAMKKRAASSKEEASPVQGAPLTV